MILLSTNIAEFQIALMVQVQLTNYMSGLKMTPKRWHLVIKGEVSTLKRQSLNRTLHARLGWNNRPRYLRLLKRCTIKVQMMDREAELLTVYL